MTHHHTFTLKDSLTKRYRCPCGVVGRRKGSRIVPLACQYELAERKHCAQPAVVADGNRQHNRCGEHA